MLGYPHPDHLLSVITSRQLLEWKALYYLESGEYEKNRVKDTEELKAHWRGMFQGRIKK